MKNQFTRDTNKLFDILEACENLLDKKYKIPNSVRNNIQIRNIDIKIKNLLEKIDPKFNYHLYDGTNLKNYNHV